MSVLVCGEITGSELSDASRRAVTAACSWQRGDVTLLLVGHQQLEQVAQSAASLDGVARIVCVSHECFEHPLAEDVTDVMMSMASDYDGFVAAASSFGKNIMPRFAALLNVQPLSDVIAIEEKNVFVRPIYAGNALETLRSRDKQIVMTIRATAFDACDEGKTAAIIENIPWKRKRELSAFHSQQLSGGDRPELTSARIVISGGRGVGSKDNFKLLEQLADKLGAAIGASRAAVDAGFVPNDWQVGQTGKIVAPDLYIAVGISGAIQHLAGIKDAKVIVAINKDEEAPIFQIADYGLVADLFDALPQLMRKL